MLVNIEPDSNEENHESVVEICDDGNRSTRTEKSCLTVTNVPASVFTSDKVKVVLICKHYIKETQGKLSHIDIPMFS